MKSIQLKLQLHPVFQAGDVVKVRGFDQLGYRHWTGQLGVVDCFPKSCRCYLSIWLVGYFFSTDIPLILPFTPDQLDYAPRSDRANRTGRKHKTTWQYKTSIARNRAKFL